MAARGFQLENFFRDLENWGVLDVMLPFLLIFVIIFAILQKTKILGDGKKNLNAVVALVIGLFVVIQHVNRSLPAYADPVEIMKSALPQVSLVLVAIVFLLVLIGVFGSEEVFLGVTMPGWITLVSLVIIIIIFGGAAGWWFGNFGTTLEQFFGTEGVAVFIMILVFGIIISWITGESKEKEDITTLKRLGMDFGKLFGKK